MYFQFIILIIFYFIILPFFKDRFINPNINFILNEYLIIFLSVTIIFNIIK